MSDPYETPIVLNPGIFPMIQDGVTTDPYVDFAEPGGMNSMSLPDGFSMHLWIASRVRTW